MLKKRSLITISVIATLSLFVWHLIDVGHRINNPHKEVLRLNQESPEGLWPSLAMSGYALSDSETRDTDTYDVTIGDHQFRFPIRYSDGNPRISQRDGSALLVYILPDYSSRLDIKHTPKYKEAWNEGRFGQMLLQDGRNADFDRVLATQRQSRNNYVATLELVPFDGPQGLEAEHWYRNYAGGPNQGKRELESDRFFEMNDDGTIKSHIHCSPLTGEGFSRSRCSHYFVQNGLHVKLSYNRYHYLSRWHDMRETALQFINELRI